MIYKFVGISDECLTCELCGRSELKKTIALMDESGNFGYYGSECAATLLNTSKKELSKQVRQHESKLKKEQEEIINKAKNEYYYFHPNIKKIDAHMKQLNRDNIPFSERKQYFKEWNELKQEAKKEILERFNLPENTYL